MGTKALPDAKFPDFFLPPPVLGVRISPSESSSSSISPSSDTFAPVLLAEAELTLARLERSAGASSPVMLAVSFSGDFLFLAKGASSSLLNKLMKSPGFD